MWTKSNTSQHLLRVASCLGCYFAVYGLALADGLVVPPRDYQGSLEEKAQEAIIIFHSAEQPGQAMEDVILKIQVEGDAREFAWIVPFPSEPKIAKEDEKLFAELFAYVEARNYQSRKSEPAADKSAQAGGEQKQSVAVLSRQTVGNFEIAVVQENEQGGLNPWLVREGYGALKNADDILAFYREQKYVFACIKVRRDSLTSQRRVESHPLRFTFATGGRDGIYFPMKMTGLQKAPFDVNLYVFFRFWLNDKLSGFGYQHRGLTLQYRDWDSPQCVANGGKSYSLPSEDPFLRGMAHRLPTVTKLLQKLHPGQKYYLTNLQARGLRPEDVRQWPADLWLFPYYTNRNMIPYDARPAGPAHRAYPSVVGEDQAAAPDDLDAANPPRRRSQLLWMSLAAVLALGICLVAIARTWRPAEETRDLRGK